ncbi:hypothetical protein C8J57DRAFT_1729235 [Mycena rebaudengoi]|nr:hypothetical protein C8J57DRAFT_1729235 [Mycena rebaudengoi]
MKLGALDALFGVLSDPIAFLNFEMWRAKLAAALAFIAWTGTFAVIPVPGPLTISNFQTNTQSQTNCTSFNSTCIVAVEFRDNHQNVKVLDIKVGHSFGTGSTIIIDDPTFRPALAALRDAISTALIGGVFQDQQVGLQVTGGTLALFSALADNSLPGFPVFRNDTLRLIEELLTNATVSMMPWNP